MKKIFLRLVSMLLVICVVAAAAFVAPILKSGYTMYKDAVSEKSIVQVVNEARNKEGYIKLEDVSKSFAAAVVESEDRRFYDHGPVDFIAIVRAMYHSVKERSFVEGGSTITQQVAKNLYFSFDKKLERKVAEAFMATDLEKLLTKDEILELYINIAYFGEGCYGIKDAAKHYYGSTPASLNDKQIAALVFTLKRPNDYNPNAYRP